MARNLIGTGADQVSVNGMLGELAFQSKENVNFTGGTGKLSKLDIDSISAQLNVSAVDVFVYDTSKDSDGGAWRKRCQHTSWYNEELNTSTRGSRREFPSVAVIVVTSSSLIIYDGDDASLPMWMVFNYGQQTTSLSTMTMLYAIGTAVCAKNGIIYSTGNTSWHDGLTEIKLVADTAFWRNSGNVAYWKTSILNRNVAGGYGVFVTTETSKHIVDPMVNDVAVSVLPTASTDAITGLPIPTVALGTQGGVSVIKSDGTVIKGTNSSGVNYNPTHMVYIDSTYRLWYGQDSIARDGYVVDLLSLTGNWTADNGSDMLSGANGFSFACAGENANVVYSPVYPTASNDVTQNAIASGTNLCLLGLTEGKLQTGSNVPLNVLVAHVSSKYNTGWMPGATKGAWLSDTTQETIVSNQLVSNPGPSFTNTTGWYLDAGNSAGSSLSVSSGKIVFTHGSTNNYWDGFGFSFPVIAGKTYTVVADIASVTNMNVLRVSINDPSQHNEQYPGSISAGINQLTFIAATSGTAYAHWNGYLTSSTMQVNSVSVRIADADRTVNNRGMQVFGTITKTPVAVGAELMAYSNFSSTNYLEQQYTGLFDFGTGSFSFSGWVKINAHQYQGIAEYSRPGVDSDGSILLFATTTGTLEFYTRSNGGGWSYIISPTLTTGTWIHLCCTRDTLGNKKIYVNGVFAAGGNDGALNVTATGYSPRIGFGSRVDGSGSRLPLNGSLALWKVSATAPSDAMVAKMYNDEKQLFQENAKATLYGTSDNVVALAYDQDTNLLHAGTSSGRSVFQGLRRIDNTTTAVTTSISAANGLVAEQ